MSYFIYRIKRPSQKKELEYLCEYRTFKEAKQYARDARRQLADTDDTIIKIIFAASQDEAKGQLQAVRSAPILKEWEK